MAGCGFCGGQTRPLGVDQLRRGGSEEGGRHMVVYPADGSQMVASGGRQLHIMCLAGGGNALDLTGVAQRSALRYVSYFLSRAALQPKSTIFT